MRVEEGRALRGAAAWACSGGRVGRGASSTRRGATTIPAGGRESTIPYRAAVLPVWLDGALLDPADARVPVSDHGITVGDGVFETLRTAPEPGTDRWAPFAVNRKSTRLNSSH